MQKQSLEVSLDGEKVFLNGVKSSNIRAIGYTESGNLYVFFSNNKCYRYLSVPLVIFNEFMASPSLGAYFAQNVKNAFECKMLPEDSLDIEVLNKLKVFQA